MHRNFGWATAAPIAAAKVDKKTKLRTEKQGSLRTLDFAKFGCTEQAVEIWHQGGCLTRRIFPIDSPDGVLERLDWKDAYRRANVDGTYRGYVEYEARCHCGGHVKPLRERTDTTPEDVKRGFNRSENVGCSRPGRLPIWSRMPNGMTPSQSTAAWMTTYRYAAHAATAGSASYSTYLPAIMS
jgi:hypothetical protein